MSDSFCWTPQRKILTPAQTGLRALPVFGIRSSTCADRPLVPHSHPGCLEVVFFLSGFQIYETEAISTVSAATMFSSSGPASCTARAISPKASAV